MNNKWKLIIPVGQIVVGLAAIAAFIVIAVNGGPLGKWIPTLLLAVGYVVVGIIGLMDYMSQKKE